MASKLPKPSHVPRPTPSALPRMRRSKSYGDIRTMKIEHPFKRPALATIPQNPTPSLARSKTTTSASAVKKNVPMKRPAVKKAEEPKAKVPKQTKVPDWDYKTRFSILNEKHNQLKASYEEQKAKLTDLADIEERFKLLEDSHSSLSQGHKELLQKYKVTDESNRTLQTTLSNLQLEYTTTLEELNSLKTQHSILVSKELAQATELERLLVVEQEHNLLKQHHQHLTQEHNKLRTDSEQCLREKDDLEKKLTNAIQKKISLYNKVTSLQGDLFKSETTRRALHNTVQELKGNIRVFCRVRPPIQNEEDKLPCNIYLPDETCIEIRKSKESVSTISGRMAENKCDFTFDRVFGQHSTQAEIFEELSQLVQSALDGYDVCVFAYGQTGSGKTYTMQGLNDSEHSGMIPRTVYLIFDKIKEYQGNQWRYNVKVSFLEIYNEMVRDLLEPEVNQNLEIKFNGGKGTTVANLNIVEVSSAEDLMLLMSKAHYNRTVAATNFNEYSSRSHAVTKIYLKGYNDSAKVECTGSINLVDLAGSENAKCTPGGERLAETKHINKSLSTLGTVMMGLWKKEKHIPYRNSKLTYLLQSSLGGNSKTLMVANISPFEENYNETINSLRFASKVKQVKTIVSKNRMNTSENPP